MYELDYSKRLYEKQSIVIWYFAACKYISISVYFVVLELLAAKTIIKQKIRCSLVRCIFRKLLATHACSANQGGNQRLTNCKFNV